jgi:hypothetical protein
MDLAVAKLNLAGVAMSRRRKLEATNLPTKIRQARHVERANYHERSNEKNTSKRANKIICPFIYTFIREQKNSTAFKSIQ